MIDWDEVRREIMRDEGLRLKPYKCTAGKVTIGYGRNLDDVGISEYEAGQMLTRDIRNVGWELDDKMPGWRRFPDGVARGLVNMCFNLGWTRLSKFKKMLAALKAEDYNRAADEALDSKWAKQVGARANRIAELFRSEA